MGLWRTGQLNEIEAAPALREPAFWRDWTDDPEFGDQWRSIRRHFGIRAFGVNAHRAVAGHELIVRHDEASFGGQEELYVVLEGRAKFTCDGAEIELGRGGLLYAQPDVVRHALALETPTALLMIGATPGEPYTIPDWDRG